MYIAKLIIDNSFWSKQQIHNSVHGAPGVGTCKQSRAVKSCINVNTCRSAVLHSRSSKSLRTFSIQRERKTSDPGAESRQLQLPSQMASSAEESSIRSVNSESPVSSPESSPSAYLDFDLLDSFSLDYDDSLFSLFIGIAKYTYE